MSGALRLARPRIALAALILSGLALAAPASQTPRPAAGEDDLTLTLMIRTKPDTSRKEIEDILKVGMTAAGGQYDKLNVDPVPAAVFDALSRLMDRAGADLPAAAIEGGIDVRQLPVRGTMWEFRLPKTRQSLRELTIEYRKAGAKKYRADAADENDRLTLIVPGSYAVRILPDDDPVKYTADVVEVGQGAQKIAKEWPQLPRYWAVRLTNFRGSTVKALFDVLRDPKKMGTPIKDIEPIRNFTFAFANWNWEGGNFDDTEMNGHIFIPRVSGIPPLVTRRVWMLFPLTRKEADDALAAYRKHGFLELPQEIRKAPTAAYGQEFTVDATKGARWFELLDKGSGNGFSREVPLSDFRQLLTRYDQFWRLLVWEFDMGGAKQAQGVKDPADMRRTVYVLAQEIKGLPAAVNKLARADGGDKPNTKSDKPEKP